MSKALTLEKYSLGMGDRFAHQAGAQLRACILAAEHGAEVIPVWNKSNREHATIGSEPSTTRAAADAAVKALRWQKPYHVDADHIRLETVDRFIPHSDFFTIDVADSIGKVVDPAAVDAANSAEFVPVLVEAALSPIKRPSSLAVPVNCHCHVCWLLPLAMLLVPVAGRIEFSGTVESVPPEPLILSTVHCGTPYWFCSDTL